MLTLVTLVVVPLLVADELLEAPSGVAGLLVNCFISIDPTGEELRGVVAIPLGRVPVDVFAAFLTLCKSSDDFPAYDYHH